MKRKNNKATAKSLKPNVQSADLPTLTLVKSTFNMTSSNEIVVYSLSSKSWTLEEAKQGLNYLIRSLEEVGNREKKAQKKETDKSYMG